MMKGLFIRLSILLIGLVGGTEYATAGCTPVADWTNKLINYSYSSPVIIQRDAPIGTIVNTQKILIDPSGSRYATCVAPPATDFVSSWRNGWNSDSNSIAVSNVPGVGVRVGMSYGGGLWGYVPFTRPGNSSGTTGWNWGAEAYWQIEIIKIGPVSAGVLPSGIYTGLDFAGAYNIQSLNITSGAAILPVACAITTPNIQVPLDDVLAASLNGAGTTAKPRDFNLGLNCDAGARVNVTMTGEQHSDTFAPGVLQLSNPLGSDTAVGVGIQILYDGSPLPLNTNMVLRTSAGGVESFPFTARYYQTRGAVRTGTANATATLNLTYQ